MLCCEYTFIDTAVPFGEMSRYLRTISETRRKRITSFRADRDKLLSLYAELLIRYSLSEKTGLPAESLSFGYGRYGKPFVREASDISFSVSHSGSCVMLAVSDRQIGADTEQIADTDIGVAKRCFGADEYDLLVQNGFCSDTFFRLWTAKEAYVKMLGTGLYTSLDSFDTAAGIDGCAFEQRVVNGYAMSICMKDPACKCGFTEIPCGDILRHFCR